MKEDILKKYYKYVFVILLIAILYLSFQLIQPFITALFASALLSYLFFPVYRIIYTKLHNKNIASFITCILILLIILIPLFFIANHLINESKSFYQKIESNDFPPEISNFIKENMEANSYIKQGVNSALKYLIDETKNFIVSIPLKLLNFFIMLFIIFYLFKDGPVIVDKITSLIPLEEEYKEHILKEIKEVTSAIIFGVTVTSLIQGAVGGLGFLIFGIESPIMWGFIMAILAMIPFMGPAFIWVPAGIIQIIYGNLFSGIGILAYGISIISTIDNIIKPKIIGSKANIHPVIILMGIFGGIKMFGFIGIVVGPLILSLLLVTLRIYKGVKDGIKSKKH